MVIPGTFSQRVWIKQHFTARTGMYRITTPMSFDLDLREFHAAHKRRNVRRMPGTNRMGIHGGARCCLSKQYGGRETEGGQQPDQVA